jgi:xanthine dehydrogenase YagR molybdenum-binding subunit
MMGVDLDRMVVRLGDSDLPAAAVYAACVKLRDAVAQKL